MSSRSFGGRRLTDETIRDRARIDLEVFVHTAQLRLRRQSEKTCYAEALKAGARIVVMVHPDYHMTLRCY